MSVPETEVPPITEAAALFGDMHDTDSSQIILPISSPNSARHIVKATDGRVGKDGRVFAFNPNVEHSQSQHEDMRCFGWREFRRNTAVRSVSMEGVD